MESTRSDLKAHAVTRLLRYHGSRKRHPEVSAWLAAQSGDLGALARRWFTRLRQCGADVRELMHDTYATVCVQDAPFAYVGVFKAHVNVGFFRGVALADPACLLVGTGKSMRHVKLVPGAVVDSAALEVLIRAAHRDIVARLEEGAL